MDVDNGLSEEDVILAKDLQAFKWYFTACASLLFYDYLLTWPQEWKYAWNGRRKGHVFYLFIIARYIPIAFCIITMSAYFSPLWTFDICSRFVIVEWLQTLLIVIPAETVLLLRVKALTNNRPLAFLLASIAMTQCIVVFYAMAQRGQNNALPVPQVAIDPFHVCILYSDPKKDIIYLSFSIAFDCIVFLTTLVFTIRAPYSYELRARSQRNRRTRYPVRLREHIHVRPRSVLLSTIQRDGVLYFSAILSGNVIWMILSLHGRPGLKLMNAQPSMILTSIMINRLTLSLRRAGYKQSVRGMNEIVSEWPLDMLDTDDEDSEGEALGVEGEEREREREDRGEEHEQEQEQERGRMQDGEDDVEPQLARIR